jgi:N12 class adenine-specific DNA methylase
MSAELRQDSPGEAVMGRAAAEVAPSLSGDGDTANSGMSFAPTGQTDLAPTGEVARVRANLRVLQVLRAVQEQKRPASPQEQQTLARWSGWGTLPAIFDPGAASYEKWNAERSELEQLLSADERAAAARSTINAHYTDASYVTAIWHAVERLGFQGGRGLEPGCGSGNFLAFAPEAAEMVGVELDPTTAAIAHALYPRAQVRAESFADSPFAEASFDLVIGNVPFGDVVVHDRRHNTAGHRIHNHFIIKSLHLTRPGGLVAILTSRYTLDAANPGARREIAELADLVGAVRLPTGAHRRAAGTDVVTDLLLLRRREAGREPAGAVFERSLALDGELAGLRVNEYFVTHPDQVLGRLCLTQGDRGRAELGVEGARDAAAALQRALDETVARALELGLRMDPARPATRRPLAHVDSAGRPPEGFLRAPTLSTFTRELAGAEVSYVPPASQTEELRALIGLRDNVIALLELEAASNDDPPELPALREQLNARYDHYIATYGPLKRFKERRTGRIDPDTGEEKWARLRPPQGGFRADPFAPVVYALELFDDSTQTAAKATIFRERTVVRPARRLGADTPEDALAIALDATGEARLEEIARLLGVSPETARAQLGALVFDEPGSDRLVPAAEYLSGNVREKLAAARAAHEDDARFAPNVEALLRVIPRDLGPGDIRAQLGAAWIDARYVEQFLREILEDRTVRVEHPGGAMWVVRAEASRGVQATSRWGTERYPAPALAQALLEQRPIRVYDVTSDGDRTFNPQETFAAAEKATELSERFSEWVWEQPERATQLVRTYNDRFNAIVPRSYDNVSLTLPGLALTFRPRPHQVAAVARIIHEPAVGLFHEVGAGKTAEMVMGAMELRRLGFVSKPVVVVPNHMLEQFSSEWLQMYPQARLLVASKEDLDRDNRRLFVAKCATGDWDAIVMTRSAFERIPMSLDAQATYLRAELHGIEAMLERAQSSGMSLSLKRLEKTKLHAEERIKSKLDGAKDPGLHFEQLGIDYIFADEAHAYKNLRTNSNIPGMSVDGSQRASDMHMKIEYLRARHGRWATLATATPIANSMGEVYTMQRYLRPDLLQQAGLSEPDQWAATFGQTTTVIEVAPDGSRMRMQTRFAKFCNVPELLQIWHVSADIKTSEDLKLPVPALAPRSADGQRAPETVVVAASEPLRMVVADLATRADAVRARRVDPSVDNLLKISSDGRAAGLDLRLLGATTSDPQKVEIAAANIAKIYEQHKEARYPGPVGEMHPRPGALQLVFCDLGTPKDDVWNVYDELRSQLYNQGVPRQAVRFIHEASSDREKAELFTACRDGRVAVLIGSTERMGVGTNVQLRAVALHHLDCPWRPADIVQREGRILRQGNANPEVQILRYVTERSFDAYLWQTVSRKAQYIGQVIRGRLDVREIEDVGDAALSYQEVKALAAGNPLLLEHAQLQAQVTRFERLERAYGNTRAALEWTVRNSRERVTERGREIGLARAACARYEADKREGRPRLVVGASAYEKRADGNAALRTAVAQVAQAFGAAVRVRNVTLGTLRGFPVVQSSQVVARQVTISLSDVPGSSTSVSLDELGRLDLLARLEHRLNDLPAVCSRAEREIGQLRLEDARAREELEKPFRHAAQLADLREQLTRLDEVILGTTVVPSIEPAPGVEPAAAPAARSDATKHECAEVSPEKGPTTTASSAEVELSRRERDKLVARVEAEFDRSARPIPDNDMVRGRLARVETGADGIARAVVVTEGALYIASLSAQSPLQPRVGSDVTLRLDQGRRVHMQLSHTRESKLER